MRVHHRTLNDQILCAQDAAKQSTVQVISLVARGNGADPVSTGDDTRSHDCVQSVAERLPLALAPADRDMLAAVGPPAVAPDVPGAVIMPGSGPHAVDYTPAGEETVCCRW